MIDQDTYPLWNSPTMSAYLTTLSAENMLVEGDGVRVRDAGGRWFLDARSGLWNVTLGYRHPQVMEAIERQLHKLPYANLIGYGRPGAIAVEAAEALLPHLPVHLNKIRYCANGAQAVETAVLLSRFLHHARGDRERLAVFGMWRGYHGLGAGGGALTGMPYVHEQSGPLLPEIHHVAGPFEGGEVPAGGLEQTIAAYGAERVAAVVLELVVGEGGHVLSDGYLHSLARFCRGHGIHLIVDEVSTGMGRTGAFTRTEQVGIRPDILTLGKGLSAGYAPLSAVALSDEVSAHLFDLDFDHKFLVGSTNDGHPLGLAASMAVIDTLANDGVLENVQAMGARLREGLSEVAARHPQVAAVRGTGLMQAVELAVADDGALAGGAVADHLRLAMEARGVLVSSLSMVPAIMIIPPLVVTEDDVEEILTALDKALGEIRS
ncbi:aminotransferase class III-fold pyridoxal phosphate-dependent enzyme [Streptomyces sp. NPDC007851]|uniref:aminotransferase class III-fold pyridoxal phosphate-dependent enzyme n=1 Tax=Streptomyces sp. NPDC007851 TaxID=3155008 RepID=UPI003400B413